MAVEPAGPWGRRRPARIELAHVTDQAAGSAAGVSVELSIGLHDQLSALATGAGFDELELVDGLTGLVSLLTEAVSGYAGLRLTLVNVGHPVQLTVPRPTPSDQSVATSLRLPLSLVSRDFEEGSRLVVWSSVPGSLVDLAADLGYVLHDHGAGSARQPSNGVTLDVDLPMPSAASKVRGLHELATIHRAAGVLIERGHDPDSVHETLRARASDEGLTAVAWADQLLRRPRRPLDRGETDHDDR